MTGPGLPPGGGLLLVDKPSGCTSHDVVSRVRRVLGLKRVGHAGTLDPMATGLLVLAADRATRLLGHLALTDKTYRATIRLGVSTDSDDADGTVTGTVDATGLDDDAVAAAMAALTGDLLQVPSAVSAIKVDGRRAYERVRAGERVELAARPVTVGRFDLIAPARRADGRIDLDVTVDCTTGTYVRSLARDLGAALGVGGHLTALRRTRVGPFGLDDSPAGSSTAAGAVDVFGGPPADRPPVTDELTAQVRAALLPAADAVRRAFPVRTVTAAQAVDLGHGRRIDAGGIDGTYAAFDPAGALVALVADQDGRTRSVFGWQTGT